MYLGFKICLSFVKVSTQDLNFSKVSEVSAIELSLDRLRHVGAFIESNLDVTATQSAEHVPLQSAVSRFDPQDLVGCCLIILSMALVGYICQQRASRSAQKLREQVNNQIQEIAVQKEQIQSVTKELDDLLAEKNDMLLYLSHEMKTPISIIKGALDEVGRENLAPNQKKAVDLVYKNSDRLLVFVNKILFNYKSTKIKKPRAISVPFSTLVRATLDSFKPLLSQKKQVLRTYIEAEISIIGFVDRLEIMLSNILTNAIKHNPEHTVINIHLKLIENQLVLIAEDNGNGMPITDKEYLPSLNSVEAAPQTKMDTGFGLHIINEIAAEHQGYVEFRSIPEEGTTMCVFLPNAIAETPASAQCLNYVSNGFADNLTSSINGGELLNFNLDSDQQNSNISMNQRPTLLLVDDEEDVLILLKIQLEESFNLLFASDISEALVITEKARPDLVIIDLVMQGAGGIDFVREMRSTPNHELLPIIILSASSNEQSHSRAIEQGADCFMEKPVDRKLLLANIKRLLEKDLYLRSIQKEPEGISCEVTNELEEKLTDVVARQFRNPAFDVQGFSRHFAMSERVFQRKVKDLTGLTPQQFLFYYRTQEADKLLSSDHSIEKVVVECGFKNPSQMRNWFQKVFGESPTVRRNSHV